MDINFGTGIGNGENKFLALFRFPGLQVFLGDIKKFRICMLIWEVELEMGKTNSLSSPSSSST
jgi:hypothetical protein